MLTVICSVPGCGSRSEIPVGSAANYLGGGGIPPLRRLGLLGYGKSEDVAIPVFTGSSEVPSLLGIEISC